MMLTITGPLSFWASSGHFKGALIKRSCEGLTAVEWSLTFWLLVARDAREKLLGKNVWEPCGASQRSINFKPLFLHPHDHGLIRHSDKRWIRPLE